MSSEWTKIGVMVGILAAGGYGWVNNLIKLASADFEAPYKTEVVRAVGLIPVVGAITGYMTIGEENND